MKPNDLPVHLAPRSAPGPASASAGPGVVLELQALALRHARFEEAALAVTAALALRVQSWRVSLALRDNTRRAASARVAAVSSGSEPDARRQAVRQLCDAADEALDRAAPVELPLPPAAARGPDVAHAALLSAGAAAAVLSVPFEIDAAWAGVFVFEQRVPLDDAQRALALDAALFIGPVLLLKARLDAPWRDRLRALLRPTGGPAGLAGLSSRQLGVLAAAVGASAALAWPIAHHVVAPVRIEGLGQRLVTAPADGYLGAVAVRPGETVKAGQLLATLDEREPTLEVERTAAERAQLERQYRDAMARDDAGQIVVARARHEQAVAQNELALRRLERTRIVAPFDGVLIGGDLGPSIGMPVKRGQELMVVAPALGWRLVAEVDEQDIADVLPGQPAYALFAALPGPAREFTLDRVAPVATPLDGRNVFEAEGRLGADAAGLRPGLRGVVRIAAGERSTALAWWARGSNWLRRTWWTFMA